MEFPDGSKDNSVYQPYIRAAHKARSEQVYRLAGITGRAIAAAALRLIGPLVRGVSWLNRARRLSQARRELRAMDDRLLSDMGITREEIDAVVRNGKAYSNVKPAPAHPHEAKQAAKVVELHEDTELMGALIVHGPWSRYSGQGRRRDDAA